MSEPFMSEIKLVSFNYPPKSWALCNGQFLPINQNQALFALLGTTYGGNGQTTFALPDLRGRAPLHMGSGHTLGERAGQSANTINIQQLPTHTHTLQGSSNTGSVQDAANNVFGTVPGRIYTDPTNVTTLTPQTVTSVGGSQPHQNMQPYLVLNFCIALQGIFPSQN